MNIAKQKGQRAENSAHCYLESQGLRLINKNYYCRLGEIDLIMQDEMTLVFIEVRFRQHANYGSSLETIRPYKQRRLIQSALHYLQTYNLYYKTECRFDTVGFHNKNNIIWIKDAFQVE